MAKKVTPKTEDVTESESIVQTVTEYIERPALTYKEVADIAGAVLKDHFDLKMRPTQETRLIRAAIIAGIEVALAKQEVKGDEA